MDSKNKHIHLSQEELIAYITSEHMLERHIVEQIELELQLCDSCSDLYMQVMEDIELGAQCPHVPQAIESIQLKIEEMNELEQEAKHIYRKKWYEYSSVQFVAAASITGLLFISGFLSFISTTTDQSAETAVSQPADEHTWFELETPEWLQSWYSQLPDLQQLDLFKEEDE